MKLPTFLLAVAATAVAAGCVRASGGASAASVPTTVTSTRCKSGEVLVAQNHERFPIYYTLVQEVNGLSEMPPLERILGNTGPLQTDTLAEVNAASQRVTAWPDKAHQVNGQWGVTNAAHVTFSCVTA